jgi:hypothetical protein
MTLVTVPNSVSVDGPRLGPGVATGAGVGHGDSTMSGEASPTVGAAVRAVLGDWLIALDTALTTSRAARATIAIRVNVMSGRRSTVVGTGWTVALELADASPRARMGRCAGAWT